MALLATLEAMRTHIGTLVVSSDVEPAEVWINRRRAGTTGAPLHVLAGDVTFEVRVAGRTSSTRTVAVVPNGVAREAVRFSLDEPAPDGAAQASQGATGTTSNVANAVSEGPRNDPDARVLPPPSTGGARSGRSGGPPSERARPSSSAASPRGSSGRSAADAYNNDPTCPGVGAPAQSDSCASAQSTAATLEPLAWVAGGLGVALAVTGAALVGTASAARTSPAVSHRCGPVVGPWSGVSCGLSF